MITVFAPDGMGEVAAGAQLAKLIYAAVDDHAEGPLQHGDIVVVTSKIISKAQGLVRRAEERDTVITEESVRTVARRGPVRIVVNRQGLTLAAAGVDNSNVAAGTILVLPVDPDACAADLRVELEALAGVRLAVVVSDTAGRAWRIGQTDQAIGASGIRVLERYAGRVDSYGNELSVTAIAVADEVASAADLVKRKLAGRPVAVVRGLADQLAADGPAQEAHAAELVRDVSEDLFRYGAREAVVAAVLAATGQQDQYEAALGQEDDAALVEFVLAGSRRTGSEADLLRSVLQAALGP